MQSKDRNLHTHTHTTSNIINILHHLHRSRTYIHQPNYTHSLFFEGFSILFDLFNENNNKGSNI